MVYSNRARDTHCTGEMILKLEFGVASAMIDMASECVGGTGKRKAGLPVFFDSVELSPRKDNRAVFCIDITDVCTSVPQYLRTLHQRR